MRSDHRPTIDQLLDDAEVLRDRYDDYDAAAVCERIFRRLEPQTLVTGAPDTPGDPRRGQPEIMSEPALYATDHEQAAHDLDLAVSLVVGLPQAAANLARLMDTRRAEPRGALVFASLLHLIGHTDAAQFWWQFAAGGGSRNAAFCLYLYHRCRGEYRDALYWRDQSKTMSYDAPQPAERQDSVLPALLAKNVSHTLLSQVRGNRHPQLPPAVEAVLNSLRVDDDHEFGGIPTPASALPRHLADAMA